MATDKRISKNQHVILSCLSEKQNFKEQLKECSKILIEQDGLTLINYVQVSKGNGIIILSLLPFMALYCRSAQEFFNERIIEDEIDKQINDLRNGLKIYSGKYNKLKDTVLYSDRQQNQVFKNMLRFTFMRSMNIHYNLGVYFDTEGHIIGDTQIANYFLNIPDVKLTEQKTKAFEIGRILGSKISYILIEVLGVNPLKKDLEISECSKCGYRDLNTNRKSDFFNHPTDKELNLVLLHILSSIGFVRNILCQMLPKDNLWVFRIEYLVAHYAWSALKRINQHYSNDNTKKGRLPETINSVIDEGTGLFPSSFRNCMMHYDFYNNGEPVISQKYFDSRKPFYGLVESCFDGKSYDQFVSELRNYTMKLESYISSWFYIDVRKIKWDL